MLIGLVSDPDFIIKVAQGLVPGYSIVEKFGKNADIDGPVEAVWGGGGDYTGFDATAAETVTVVSSDTNDTATGTGAQTVELFGLDGAGAEITETVSLSGATPVTSTKSFLRCYRAVVRSAGSGDENAGVITIAQSVTVANVFAIIAVGDNQTMVAAYTIPAGKTGYLMGWGANFVNKTTGVSEVEIRIRPPGETFQLREASSIHADGASRFDRKFILTKGPLAPLTDIKIMADSSVVNIGVGANFSILLVDN